MRLNCGATLECSQMDGLHRRTAPPASSEGVTDALKYGRRQLQARVRPRASERNSYRSTRIVDIEDKSEVCEPESSAVPIAVM